MAISPARMGHRRHGLAGGGVTYSPVFCNAIVDPMPRLGSPQPFWKVIVNGLAPHAYQRVYEIQAATDAKAAQEGIRRFVEEFSQPQT